jgi:hypothetical protein
LLQDPVSKMVTAKIVSLKGLAAVATWLNAKGCGFSAMRSTLQPFDFLLATSILSGRP